MEEKTSSPSVRLGVYLARCGVCSRREVAKLMDEARVKVDGKVVRDLSFQVTPGVHEVRFNNKVITPQAFQTMLYNKPKGVICHPEAIGGLRSWKEDLPKFKHLRPAGRLDAMSEGLVILTNDGDLHHQLTHPSYKVPKLYKVWLRGRLDERTLRFLTGGTLVLDEKRVKPCTIKVLGDPNSKEIQTMWILEEGRNRQIRRMAEAARLTVTRLEREKIGPISVRDIPLGQVRPISKKERELLDQAIRNAQGKGEKSSVNAPKTIAKPKSRKGFALPKSRRPKKAT